MKRRLSFLSPGGRSRNVLMEFASTSVKAGGANLVPIAAIVPTSH